MLSAVVEALAAGTARGIEVPIPQSLEGLTIRRPTSAAVLPLVTDLGPRETEVLALALELSDTVVVLDDALARRMAETLDIQCTGTLGITTLLIIRCDYFSSQNETTGCVLPTGNPSVNVPELRI